MAGSASPNNDVVDVPAAAGAAVVATLEDVSAVVENVNMCEEDANDVGC